MQLTYFRGLHYNTVKLKKGNSADRKQSTFQMSNNSTFEQETATANRLSKEYKVHRATIYSDAKATKVIDAIGEVSPEAKAKILSGDVAIDKKELQRLASASDDEVSKLAFDIENGTYKKPIAKEPDSIVDSIGSAGGTPGQRAQQPTVLPIGAVADRAYKVFSETAATGTKTEIRKALRALIDELENLYAQT